MHMGYTSNLGFQLCLFRKSGCIFMTRILTKKINRSVSQSLQRLSLPQIVQAMLQLNYIRQHLKLVKEKLAIRNFKESGLVDEITKLDDERRKLQLESEQT